MRSRFPAITHTPARRRARLIRRLAGLPAGAAASRRGSTLVLIVGALAVLSVIVVGYWAIGRGDRQTGSAIVRADQVQERVEGIRDYLRSVIGRDVLGVYSEGDDLVSADPLIVGEQTDFPITDWDRRSVINPAWSVEEQDRRRFDPAGTLASSWRPDNRQILPFPPTDPWLASTLPSWVSFNTLQTPADRINERRDWWQISNFAPDGRFVNLWNLAPVVGNARVANFDAESGISRSISAPGTGLPRISDHLYLLDPVTGAARQSLDFPTMGSLSLEDLHATPAAWSMRQIGAFRPAMELQYRPDDPRNAFYMWADTDRDGMFDGRFFELVDASLPDPADPNKRLAVSVLPHDSRYRWFAAARAIDLSSLVNVNTATFVSPTDPMINPPRETDPRDRARIGATPADIDLRRLLTMEDVFLDLAIDGYLDLYNRPGSARGAPENYSDYRYASTGHRIGQDAFTALALAQRTLRVPDPGSMTPAFGALTGAHRATHFGDLHSRPQRDGGAFGLDDLVELLTYHGVNDPAVTSRLEQTLGGRYASEPRFSPLRDNRPLSLERDYLFDLENDPQVNLSNGQLNNTGAGRSSAAIIKASADVRRLLTTVSGARPLRSARLAYQGDTDQTLSGASGRYRLLGDPRRRADAGRDRPEARWTVLSEMIGDLSLRRPQEHLLADFDNRLFDPVHSANQQWQVWKPDPNSGSPTSPTLLPSVRPPHPSSAARISAHEALTLVINCVDPTSTPPTSIVGPVESCQLLFKGYADALLPCSGDEAAWDPSDPDYARMRTAFYGNDPVAAIKAAAHMAVNMRDVYDQVAPDYAGSYPPVAGDQSPPGAYTLVLRKPLDPTWGRAAPGLHPSNSGGEVNHPNSVLTLPSGRGFPDNAVLDSPAIDIYGVEAQAFIAQAASYIIYTDRKAQCGRTGDGADEDGDTSPGDPCPSSPTRSGGITIHGRAHTDNLDFIGQVLAVQLHNPFDESIDLEGYSIQFGGRTHALPAHTLAPRATVAVAVTYPSVELIESRIDAADSTCSSTMGRDFDSWLDAQVGSGAVKVSSTDPLLADHDPTIGSRDNEANRVVLLWRTWQVNAPGGTRDVRMLADRLRDPASPGTRPTLDRRMDDVNEDVVGAIRDTQCDADNRGLSVTFWGTIRRPDDPRVAMGDIVPRGIFPAWCLERKDRGDGLGSLNDAQTDPLNPEILSIGDFQRTGPPTPGAQETLAELLTEQSNAANVLIPTMVEADPQNPSQNVAREPRNKSGNALDSSKHLPRNASQRRPGRDVRQGFGEMTPEIRLDNRRFLRDDPRVVGDTPLSTLRPADMLLALAVGPEHDPFRDDEVYEQGTGTMGDDAWTTLSEAMAMALGFDDDPPPPAGRRPTDLYEITDGGYLRLDDYVPFINHSDDPTNPMLFNPGGDERRSAGIPLALNVLDVFTVRRELSAEPETPDPARLNPGLFARHLETSSALTKPVPGLINIGTAPLAVLRTLPMLSPPPDADPSGYYAPGLWWWPGGPHDSSSDIASTVVAYRDLIALGPRGATGAMVDFVERTVGAPAHSGDPTLDSFTLYSEPWVARAVAGTPNPQNPSSPTEINGLRERPGFAGVGELLAVRDLLYPSSTVAAPMDMDRLGFDGMDMDRAEGGVDSFLYKDAAGRLTLDDELLDDYDEKLAIANAAAASASVRSDYFAVWFIVHGYQRTDVEGLRRSDMIRPSIARRFLMILDRSNVVREGDLPKMLVFKELPM